jgi:hypothetical protein
MLVSSVSSEMIKEYFASFSKQLSVGRSFHQPETGWIAMMPDAASSAAVPVHKSE